MLNTALLMLFASTAQADDAPVIPAFFTAERLYEICTGRNPGQCWMYVAGVLDGMFEAQSRAATRSICPTRLTNRDAANLVINFLRDNPEFRSKAAAVAVKTALRPNLECTAS